MRDLTVNLDEILSLVDCSESYGFTSQVLFAAFGQWTGPVSDAEIAEWIAANSDTSDDDSRDPTDHTEDERRAKWLTEWRDKYAA